MATASASEDLLSGTRCLLAGDVVGALAALTRAVEAAPFDVPARFNRAVALRLQGDARAALAEAEAVLRLGGDGAPARAHAGLLRQLAGDLDAALAHYRAALAVEPLHRVSRYYLGMALRLRGENADAVAALEGALAPGGAPLPEVVRERIRGQLHDARLAAPAAPPVRGTLCATAAVTEVMSPAGGEAPALETPPDEPAARAGREVDVAEAAALLHRARRVVALTGAGLSVASGLHTRKDLWRVYDRDDAVSVARFRDGPWMLWAVVRDFLGDNGHAPNPAHDAIARLPRLAGVVTQNVDELHQRADARAGYPIVELHGSLGRTRCHACGLDAGRPASSFVAPGASLPPTCARCGGALRPDVVLFGEQVSPSNLERAVELVLGCDLLLVVGCAMDVAPASELPRLAARAGAVVLELKRSRSRVTDAVGAHLLPGAAADTLPAVYDALAELEPLPPRAGDAQRRTPAPLREAAVLRPSVTFEMPRVGEAVVEVTVGQWLKRPGDVVLRDEPLVQVDTDKVTIDIPSAVAGVLRRQLAGVGDVVPVGGAFADVEPFAPGDPRCDARLSRGWPPFDGPLRGGDPIAADFGPHAAGVYALLREMSEARWLSPDTALMMRDAGATAWLAERLDEHLGALAHYDRPSFEGLTLRLWVTSDAREAHARWLDAWGPDRASAPSTDAEVRWNAALLAAQGWLRERADPRNRVSTGALYNAVLRATRVGLRARSVGVPVDAMTTRPLGPTRAALHRAAWVGAAEAPPCPWRPLLEIWYRGAWPFALRDGVLAVYVPIVEGGRVILTPGERNAARASLSVTGPPSARRAASLKGFADMDRGPAVVGT